MYKVKSPWFSTLSKLLCPFLQILWSYQIVQKRNAACLYILMMLPLTELIPKPLHGAPRTVSLNLPWSQNLIQVSVGLPHSKFGNVGLFPTDLLCISELTKAVLGLNVSLWAPLSNHVSSWAIPPFLRLACAIFIMFPVFFQTVKSLWQHSSSSLTAKKSTFSQIFICSRERPRWGIPFPTSNDKEFETESTSRISLFCVFCWEEAASISCYWQPHQH